MCKRINAFFHLLIYIHTCKVFNSEEWKHSTLIFFLLIVYIVYTQTNVSILVIVITFQLLCSSASLNLSLAQGLNTQFSMSPNSQTGALIHLTVVLCDNPESIVP